MLPPPAPRGLDGSSLAMIYQKSIEPLVLADTHTLVKFLVYIHINTYYYLSMTKRAYELILNTITSLA